MVSSKAATPEAYIAELPPERRELISRVRDLVNANLPAGYVERMSWGMIGWELPLERYPNTYNKQPLVYAGLAAQKNHAALYLNCIYASEERTRRLQEGYGAAGKKLDMGKSCIRFKKAEELAEDVLAQAIASVPVEEFIAEYERTRR
ncbi:MAG TPA: DUF1801 domain-containing protein [Allosphingosinicella sp.]|nr:DUF1801 domain-containing protein [Allosphingosinicella sp.]